jgi:hypothetical protein
MKGFQWPWLPGFISSTGRGGGGIIHVEEQKTSRYSEDHHLIKIYP